MADVDDHTEETKKTSAEIVASLDDLLLVIFGHVPSEINRSKLVSKYYSLVRFKLVSRHWNSLISNEIRHSTKPASAAGLIFECGGPTNTSKHSSYVLFLDQQPSITTNFRKINSVDDPWHYRSKIIHSCNGLLLCANKQTRRVYSVCNPTTGKHSTLPKVPPAKNKEIHGVYLAFDPCKSLHYKVVCVLGSKEDGDDVNQFVVYSSETGCWGNCGEPFKTNNVRFGNKNNNNGVYWNGAIHWVCGSSQLICFNPDGDDDDRLAPPKVIPMPIARNYHKSYYFGESCGHLHYIGLNDGLHDGETEFVVHEMSSDYSGWAVKYKFDTSCLLKERERKGVCSLVRGERAEDTFLVLWTSRRGWDEKKKIIRLNLDASSETIYDFSDYKNPLQSLGKLTRPFHYIDSLASV